MPNAANTIRVTPDFSWALAQHFCDVCELSYLEPTEAHAGFHQLGYSAIHTLNDPKTDTEAFWLTCRTHHCLVYRGTEPDSWKDWKTDFRLDNKPVPIPPEFRDQWDDALYAHAGFVEAHESICLRGMLENGIRPTPFYVTGHSLGAGLSSIRFFQEMVRHTYEMDDYLTGLYTYGSPRVFLHGAANTLNKLIGKRIHRIVNGRDIVTRVPTPVRGYRHVGQLYFYDGIEWHVNPSDYYVFFRQHWPRINLKWDAFADHSMRAYHDALGNAPVENC